MIQSLDFCNRCSTSICIIIYTFQIALCWLKQNWVIETRIFRIQNL